MRKWLFILSIVSLLAIYATPANAQGRDPAQVQAQIDSAFASKLTKIKNAQATYAANHGGRYFQALWTHTNAPADANNTAPNNLNSKPHYQGEDLNYFWVIANLPAQIPNRFKIDQYDGPNGRGYVVTLSAIIGGVEYQKVAYVEGAESYRLGGWVEVRTP